MPYPNQGRSAFPLPSGEEVDENCDQWQVTAGDE